MHKHKIVSIFMSQMVRHRQHRIGVDDWDGFLWAWTAHGTFWLPYSSNGLHSAECLIDGKNRHQNKRQTFAIVWQHSHSDTAREDHCSFYATHWNKQGQIGPGNVCVESRYLNLDWNHSPPLPWRWGGITSLSIQFHICLYIPFHKINTDKLRLSTSQHANS